MLDSSASLLFSLYCPTSFLVFLFFVFLPTNRSIFASAICYLPCTIHVHTILTCYFPPIQNSLHHFAYKQDPPNKAGLLLTLTRLTLLSKRCSIDVIGTGVRQADQKRVPTWSVTNLNYITKLMEDIMQYKNICKLMY